ATMSHGEGWHFGRLGQRLERADKTSRILDVKYFILLPALADVGTPFDNLQWSALLKSASALEMFRKRWGRMSPERVADFLILDRHFPRSILHCLTQAEKSLRAISGSPPGTFQNPAEQLLGRLRARLVYTPIEEIVAFGLHEFLDDLQTQLNRIGDAIFEAFFAVRPVLIVDLEHQPPRVPQTSDA
ncbi:MAG: alpha-E domain-containing protein, partial [Candidatus Methylomirabilales bacterium]